MDRLPVGMKGLFMIERGRAGSVETMRMNGCASSVMQSKHGCGSAISIKG